MRLVDRFTAMVAELRQMNDVAGGGSVLRMAQQLFAWVAELLDQASYDEHTGQALHVVLAELGQVCGWSAYDWEYGLAQRYCIAGLRAAHTANDRPLGAYVLGSMTEQVARQGRPEDAVMLIETALAGFTRGRHTPRLLGQLYNWQAWVFAALQDPSACTAAISRARTQAEHFQPGDDPAWLYWVNAADIVAGSGQ